MLGRAREEELEDLEVERAFAGERGVAEPGVEEVDDDGGGRFVGGGVGAGGEFATVEDFEEFGDGVAGEGAGAVSRVGLVRLGREKRVKREGGTYRSPIFVVLLSFNASKMPFAFLSSNFAQPCTSLETTTNLGLTLKLRAVSRIFGNIITASKKVPNTLTINVLSAPSTTLHSLVAIPAFSTSASTRSNPSARLTNCLTDSALLRSRGQTSTTPGRWVDCSMDLAAASPLARSRTARMTLAACRRVKWRAASRPRPMLEPVTMMVWWGRGVVGYGRRMKSWL